MQLSLQTFQQLLQRMSAAVQGSASQLVDLSVGSVLRAVLEANASVGLWIQWLIVRTLSMTRAGTSVGADLDSWMADFQLTRQPATAARGTVTFTRLLTGNVATIPAGTIVKTATAGVAFSVIADVTNADWQPAIGGYFMPVGIATIDLPVGAQVAGLAGNVSAGTIAVIASALPGVDFVSNAAALAGGADPESDEKFRERFRDYINSRSRATPAAVGYAIESLQQSLRFRLFENSDTTGAWAPGQFRVVVDDGSGCPSALLLGSVYSAVEAVRPLGSTFTVDPPTVVPVSVAISLSAGGGPLSARLTAAVADAVTGYIDRLPIGATLSLTRIAEVAYRAGHLTENISSVLINGTGSDLVCPPDGLFQAQAVTVQ